ncbi:hypothetical protein [Fluviicola taffensis]|uniref:Uncharacterized protein n=1 Tax=Fluviicola taffensis (strain DSM 16823 / NCIMB 13979 / RW262) TaxID=755732 RepID=F2IGS1_FLUTR|nr:hypothetical protein [Fluviicola taffensis]AEA43688.1 hypothetical protein Fluta_1696 [Fluviicola taffensis DSM 16823]
MSKNQRPINAFIIDDKQDYIESLRIAARSKRIILDSSTNLETGIDVIKNNKQIDFVILDGKCFVDQDQELTGSTVSNIPVRAKSQIDDINREQNRCIGYCVNTGFYDDLQGNFDGVFTIFKKDDDEKLLDFVINEVSQSELYKIKNKYNECFEIFDLGIVDSKYEHLLVDVLTSIEKADYRKKNIGPMRDLLEAIYHGLISVTCIPSSFLNQNGNPNLEWCTRFMEQRTTDDATGNSFTLTNSVPQEMKSAFRKLKESTSAFAHLNDSDIIKYPFLSNSHLLLELVVWVPVFHSQHYK